MIGSEDFDGFGLTSSGGGAVYMPGDIEVTPDTFPSGLSAGLTFSLVSGLPFSVAAGESATYDIQYEFFFPSDPAASQADLGMDPPSGAISINQYYCDNADITQDTPTTTPFCTLATGGPGPSPTVLHVDDTKPPASWNSGIVPLVPVVTSFAQTITMISLDGGALGAEFGQVNGNNFVDPADATPEPSTLAIAAAGLFAVALRKRFLRP